jgi:L-lactate dehydrogenase complex protein LldG
MESRELILRKLRQLSIDRPESIPAAPKDKSIFVDYPQELLDKFKEKFKALFGELYYVKDYQEAAEQLFSMIDTKNDKACLIHPAPLSGKVIDSKPELKTYLASDDDLKRTSPDYADFETGVTCADYLVARTGSVVLNARHMGGRRLSVLPPTHIVLATRDQIVPSLEDALQAYAGNNQDWSYATIITGASRTADIEKILVLGAHGPKRLVIILIDN